MKWEWFPLVAMRAPSGRVFNIERSVVRELEALGWERVS